MKSAKQAKNKPSPNATSPVVSQLTGEEIAARAYSIWEQEGCPHGRDVDHWLQAELQILGRGITQAPPPSSHL